MRNILLTFLLFLGLQCSALLSQTAHYIRLNDASGYNAPAAQFDTLEANAQKLCALMTAAGYPQFKVYDVGFYAPREFTFGGFPQVFEQKIMDVEEDTPYYILIGKQSDQFGTYTRIWAEVKLPDVTGYNCLPNLNDLGASMLTTNIERYYNLHERAPAHANLAINEGIKALRKYLLDIQSCCTGGFNIEGCLSCKSPDNMKAYLAGQGFKANKIENIGANPLPIQSLYIDDLAHLLFTINDRDVVDISSNYLQMIDTLLANGKTVRVIITKDANLCGAEWASLMTTAKSGAFDVVYWHHIHTGNSIDDHWLYTNTYFKGVGNQSRPLTKANQKFIVTNVVAALASAATDFFFQTVIHYIFDEDINSGVFLTDFSKAVSRVDLVDVGISAVTGFFGVNSKVAAVATALAHATVQTIKLADYYQAHPPNPVEYPNGYTYWWAGKDFCTYFLKNLVTEGLSLLAGSAAGKIVKNAGEIPFPGWCKIAKLINKKLGTMIPGCFAEGTKVCALEENKSIEDIKTRNWVKTIKYSTLKVDVQNHFRSSLLSQETNKLTDKRFMSVLEEKSTLKPEYDDIDIDENWLLAKLFVIKPEGDTLDISLIRPKAWFLVNKLNEIGDSSIISFPEMGILGYARLINIGPGNINTKDQSARDLLENGYSPVITTFKQKSAEVIALEFTNNDKIHVTKEHPFWSVSRESWVKAGELSIGEEVQTKAGITRLDTTYHWADNRFVYNIEVWNTHTYFVGLEGELVHNNCSDWIVDELKKLNIHILLPSIRKPTTKTGYAFFTPKTVKINNQDTPVEIFYSTWGFPDLRKWCAGANFVTTPSGLKGTSADFKLAFESIPASLMSKVKKGGTNGTSYSPFFIKDSNGNWQEYTWHHVEDGKTMMPVLKSVHDSISAFEHSGGATILKKAPWLAGLFDSPNFNLPFP